VPILSVLPVSLDIFDDHLTETLTVYRLDLMVFRLSERQLRECLRSLAQVRRVVLPKVQVPQAESPTLRRLWLQ
jgi:hypothetical protein